VFICVLVFRRDRQSLHVDASLLKAFDCLFCLFVRIVYGYDGITVGHCYLRFLWSKTINSGDSSMNSEFGRIVLLQAANAFA
jgi:hypothetical protein